MNTTPLSLALCVFSLTLTAKAVDIQNTNSATGSNQTVQLLSATQPVPLIAKKDATPGITALGAVATNATTNNPPRHGIETRDFLPFATSLFGAFFGALGAYLVGRFKEKRDEDTRRHTALLASQYALYSQWSVVEDMRRNFLEPFREDPDRHLKQLQYFRVVGELSVPFDELTFIINSKDANLLQQIHIAEKRFTASVDLLNKLNQKRLEIQDKYPPKAFDMAIGKGQIEVPRYEIYRLKALTDLLYDEAGKALPDLWNTNQMLFKFIKANMKGRKAVEFLPAEIEAIKK